MEGKVMNPSEAKLAAEIGCIAEHLENLNVSDREAWQRAAAELDALCRGTPPPDVVGGLVALVVQGLARMAADPPADLLAAVDAMGGALAAAEAFLRGDADRAAIAAAGERLAAAEVHAGQMRATIDDAASLLVRLDPGDREGCLRLAALLRELAAGARGDRSLFDEAAALAAGIAAGSAAPGPAEALAALGALLDRAAAACELETGDAHETPAAEAPACGQAPAAEQAAAADERLPEGADADLLTEFITESQELIQSAEEALLTLENDPQDHEAVGKVFRAFHTVKGTAGFLDLKLIAELGHHAETLLSRVRDGEIRYGGGYADLTLQALDTIKALVASVQAALAGEPLRKPAGYDELLAVLQNPEAAGVTAQRGGLLLPRVGDILVAAGRVDPGEVRRAMAAHPEAKVGEALVKERSATLVDVGQALRTQAQMRGERAALESSVRVSTQRLDRLIDMVGELVIAHSMVAQDLSALRGGDHGLAKKVSHTSKIVRELQDISMSMRMVPLKGTFSKMARLARDTARKLGKNVNFVAEGEETEIDRNLVDIVNDPLVHMVRNAVDHGIEPPEERRAAGKPEQGLVKISAFHSAGSVMVEISDDGKGIDRETVIAKAKERGLLPAGPDFNDRSLSDREVFNLLFEPGFSTAKVVTDVSGRGVGMDVVKRNIESLRGTVEIRSEAGRGSTFRMSLPLTLAIIDGMVIRVGSETYVIPTIAIIRSVRPQASDISTVFQHGEMLRLQGELIPLVRLARLYGLCGATEDPAEAIVVVVEDEGRPAGLVVDELIGRQQVVIKSLGETMQNIPGISGGAIMPDGRVGLILDVGGLLRLASSERPGLAA
jgi:two-component system chemotaxis sensor kinase CheA